MYAARNESLVVTGIKMDYISFGVGKKPLVLIPGLSTERLRGKAFQMSYAYRLFAKDYRVYMFDRKEQVEEGYTISEMADELAKAMKKLRIEGAHVVGLSQGGMIAQSLAISYPKLVKKLVLGLTASRANQTIQETIGRWIALAKEDAKEELISDMLEKMYSESYRRKKRLLFWYLSKFMRPKELKRFIILATSILSFDLTSQLQSIECPVFVIGAKNDKVVGRGASIELAETLSCQSYLYDDLGHSAYMEAKDFNHRILNFLRF